MDREELEKRIEDAQKKEPKEQLASLRAVFGDKFVDAWVSDYANDDESDEEDFDFPADDEEEGS